MKKLGNWGLIGVSALLALVAAIGAYFYLSNREAEIRRSLIGNTEKVTIVVPKMDLQAGDTLHGDMVAGRPVPRDLVPSGAIMPDEFDAVEGLTLKQPIARGTPVLRHLLIGATTDDSFSMLLKKGQRALTFAIDEKTSNSHLLRPGDYVDVVLAAKDDKSSDSAISFGIIKQRAIVLATGAKTVSGLGGGEPDEGSDYQTVTLAVETREVATFMSAVKYVDAGKAKLNFLLRNPTDEGRLRSQPISTAGLIQSYGGKSGKNGELSLTVTQVSGLSGRVVASEAGEVQIFQKYVAEKSDLTKESQQQQPQPNPQ
jgi:Flp pilus assembly protein CpaB